MKKLGVILAAIAAAVVIAVVASRVLRARASSSATRAEAEALRACGEERRRTPAGTRPKNCLKPLDAFVAACMKVRPQGECLTEAQRLLKAE